jgi:hypothetical protein
MHRLLRYVIPIACAGALYAQAQGPQPQAAAAPTEAAAQPAGLETPWEMAPVLQEIGAHADRLLAELDKVDVKSWVAQGASETYAAQLQSSKDQSRAISQEAKGLARNPEKLAAQLQLFFRIQAVDTMLGSVEDGIRRYQDPAGAQRLASLNAQNGLNRDRLQGYILNLAAQREQEFQVMDREAQRCRGILTAPASSGRTSGRKK